MGSHGTATRFSVSTGERRPLFLGFELKVGRPYTVLPDFAPVVPIGLMFGTNVGANGGVAPVRNYIDELLPEVLDGQLNPGRVFDLELPMTEVAEAYAAMDERRAIKVLLRP